MPLPSIDFSIPGRVVDVFGSITYGMKRIPLVAMIAFVDCHSHCKVDPAIPFTCYFTKKGRHMAIQPIGIWTTTRITLISDVK